jgi:hypothetical protein
MPHKNSGNVLFLILLGVALFAALSYAVTGSSRNYAANISKDKALIEAGRIQQYGFRIEQAISNMRLVNKCSLKQISFDSDLWENTAWYDNPYSPTDERCHVFSSQGGGVAKADFSDLPLVEEFEGRYGYDHELFPNNVCLYQKGILNGGDGVDMMLVKPYISQEVCDAVNEKNDFNASTITAGYDAGKYRGIFGTPGCYYLNASNQTLPNSFCIIGRHGSGAVDTQVYPIFYYILQER